LKLLLKNNAIIKPHSVVLASRLARTNRRTFQIARALQHYHRSEMGKRQAGEVGKIARHQPAGNNLAGAC
jgi:hypothetical protein